MKMGTRWWFVVALVLSTGHAHAWSSGSLNGTWTISQFSTHWLIVRLAFPAVSYYWSRRLDLRFPRAALLRRFTCQQGADIAWLRGENSNRNHFYNPVTGRGRALDATSHYFSKLVAWAGRGCAPEQEGARHAAWLSHFASDALCPPHHEGEPVDGTSPRTDWHDPHSSSVHPVWLRRNKHLWFELTIAARQQVHRPFRKPFPLSDEIEEEAARISELGVPETVKALAGTVAAKGAFQRYVRDGWTPRVAATVMDDILPTAVHLTQVLWITAGMLAAGKLARSITAEPSAVRS